MSSLHPLALRILAAAGASTAAAALSTFALTTLESGCCPPPTDTGPHTVSLGANCTVTLQSGLDTLGETCMVLQVDACPPVEQLDGGSQLELACGPLRPGEPAVVGPASSSASSGVGGSGVGGTGGVGGSGVGGSGGIGGAAQIDAGADAGPGLVCCYGAVHGPGGQGCGRPLVVDGCAVTSAAALREDWCGPARNGGEESPERVRVEVANLWARDAALEHASVASFARFVLDLLSVGAPADLVRAAQDAMKDEIDHAERCYALASRYAGRALGPGPLPIEGVTVGGGLLDVALRALEEGCIGETIASITAQRALEAARDEGAREALAVIARDEAAHAELSFRFVAWAAKDQRVREGLQRALPAAVKRAIAATGPMEMKGLAATADEAAMEAHGQPGRALRVAAAREAVEQVILPCLGAICSAPGSTENHPARSPRLLL